MISTLTRRLWHLVLILCVSFIIFFAISISILRLMIPRFAHHTYLQHITSKLLNTPVHISDVKTDWYGLQPRISLNHLVILDKQTGEAALTIKHMVLQINLLSSLIHWQLLPSRLTIDGAALTVDKDKQGQFYVSGLAYAKAHHQHTTKLHTIIVWLLTQSDVTISHIHLNYLDKAQLDNMNIRIRNGYFEHHLFGAFNLLGKPNTQFQIIADLADSDDNLQKLNGTVYLSIKHFSNATFTILKSTIPRLKQYTVDDLKGSTKLWLGFVDGKLTNMLANYALTSLQFNHMMLKNVFGNIEWNRIAGNNHIHLANSQGSLSFNRWFNNPLPLGRLLLDASISYDAQGLQFKAPVISWNNGNVNFSGQLHLSKKANKPAIVDILGGFSLTDLSRLVRYLPQKIMKSHLLAWFKQAFIAGYADHGIILYRGRLQKYMQKNPSVNQFQVAAHLHQLIMSYAPHWPVAKATTANLFIHNRLLTATSHDISSMGNAAQLALTIPLKKHSILDLNLHLHTDAHQGWLYLEKTPLPLAKKLKRLNFAGPMDFNLKLRLPLHKKPHHDAITHGMIKTTRASLDIPQWNVKFTHIKGILKFHNKALYDDGQGLQARLFGHPIHLSVKTVAPKKDRMIIFNGQGALSTADIRDHFSLPLTQFFSGHSQFNGSLVLHKGKFRGNDLHISTNLVGVKSQKLPQPFAKKASEKRALHLDITMRNKKSLFLHIDYAHLASSALLYNKTAHGLVFQSGNIQLGGAKASYLSTPGLVIQGSLPKLNWAHWQHFLDQLLAQRQAKKSQHVVAVRSLSLKVGKLYAYDNIFRNVHLALTPLIKAWKVNIVNKAINGYVIIPQNHKNKWVLNFKRLHIMQLKHQSSKTVNPLALPPLQVTISDFKWSQHAYGSVALVTKPVTDGLLIKNISFSTNDNSFKAHGLWTVHNKRQHTALSGVLNTKNLGEFLNRWNNKAIIGGAGRIKYNLQWDDKLFHIDWPHLNGSLSFAFKNGSLAAVDKTSETKIGLGRLLNLLSVDSLLEKLETHFRDLTQKGLWFNEFRGNFSIKNGVATTQSIYFKGPVAMITAHGHLDLAHQTSDIQLNVTPQLTSSVPLVVGIFGGPIAGAAAWLVNKLVGPQINKISSSTYSMTGHWKKLKIAKIQSRQRST